MEIVELLVCFGELLLELVFSAVEFAVSAVRDSREKK